MLTRRKLAGVVEVKHMPPREEMKQDVLYISREFELAIHLCACGCGGQAVTPLGPTDWTIAETPRGPSLTPSIGHQHWPCRSHYHVTAGEFVPC